MTEGAVSTQMIDVSKRILLILPRRQGFFSLVFQVLGQAHLAKQAGLTPVVYFNRHCLYWSQNGYNGARNVWEYYFEPLSELTTDSLFQMSETSLEGLTLEEFVDLSAKTPITATNRYSGVVEYKSPLGAYSQRVFVNGLFDRYVKLKPHIRQKFEEFCRNHFLPGPVLGVHYRGIEKVHGKQKDWSATRWARDLKSFYLAAMQKYVRKHPSARIFVATDSEEFLHEAKARFGTAVMCRDTLRLKTEDEVVGLHFSEASKTQGGRLGEEVLLDALLLSRTSFFIHGISNVSNAAIFLNPHLRHTDLEIRHGETRTYVRREILRQVSLRSARVAGGLESFYRLLRRR